MPVVARKRGAWWRVVEAETGRIAKNRNGTPVDGGGFSSKSAAEAQARAINAFKGDRNPVTIRQGS